LRLCSNLAIPCSAPPIGIALGREVVRTRKFILLLATVAAIGLLLSMLPVLNLPRIRGSLSNGDVRAIRKEIRRVRWGTIYFPLYRWHLREFGRFVRENLDIRLVSVEGNGTQAIAECRDSSNQWILIYEFTNSGGLCSCTTSAVYDSSAK